MGNWAGMRKAPPMGNPHPRPRFKLCGDGDGDGDGFGGGDGDGKAIPSPAPPRPIAIVTPNLLKHPHLPLIIVSLPKIKNILVTTF